jgi:outer membrane protein with beta-barrel domain
MQTSAKRVIFLATLLVGICVAPVFAQEYEIHPYAGGLFVSSYTSPMGSNSIDFKNPAIFGLKGGAFVTDHWMIEGNAGWMNQFNFGGYNYRTSGILYEADGSYHFYTARIHGVVPFASFGVGGLTIKTRSGVNNNTDNESVYVLRLNTPQPTAGPIPNTLTSIVLRDNQTFFNFSYGGGLKGERLWGPIGLRADVRGRTLPNFFGKAITSLEATGGLLISWGER